MADFLLRDIDDRVAERIKELARQRGWPLNDVILHLVKQALGLAEPEPPPVPGDIARLMGAWDDAEVASALAGARLELVARLAPGGGAASADAPRVVYVARRA